MLTTPAAIEAVTDVGITSSDFYRPHHGVAYAYLTSLWAAGEPTDPLALTKRLSDVGELRGELSATLLVECQQAVPVAAEVGWYARIVAEAAFERRVAQVLERGQQIAATDPHRALDATAAALAELDNPTSVVTEATALELDDFLAVDDPEYDWLIPGLVERGDRIILTGQEGKGKSTLLRQVAVQAACGIHPFVDEETYAPLSVVYVDLENGDRHTRRKLRPLRLAAGDRYKPQPGLHVECRPAGLDLLHETDGRWLLNVARTRRADILLIGPTYKLANGDPTLEETAKPVSVWLDRIRTEVGCALLLESHTPYGQGGGKRPERPYGASLWSRWPEFGVFLAPDGNLRHWRGQRDERNWPAALQKGGSWPWSPVTKPDEVRWARIVELCTEAGDQLTERDLAEAVGVSKTLIHKDIERHRDGWDALASSQVTGG